jgi:hypothetical protein
MANLRFKKLKKTDSHLLSQTSVACLHYDQKNFESKIICIVFKKGT